MVFRAHARKFMRSLLLIGVSVFLVAVVFRLADAGSLTPPAPPVAGTMHSIASISAPLFGSGSYDSTLVVQDDDGNALEISKCIIDIVNGGPGCP